MSLKKSVATSITGQPVHSATKCTKSKLVPKERRTWASQIKALASKDAFEAMLLAKRGRQFSAIEHNLERYYVFWEQVQKLKSCEKFILEEGLRDRKVWPKEFITRQKFLNQKNFADEELKLCEFFLNCVRTRNSARINEIAEAVEFLKTFKESPDQHFRADILLYKSILDPNGIKWPIRLLAQLIDWPKTNRADGLAQLRRLCKDLNFPLAPSRQRKTPPQASQS